MAKEKRTRRSWSAEFKVEAVHRLEERRAKGVSIAHVARELGLRADVLASWAKQANGRAGVPPADVFPGQGRLPSEQEELRQLRRQVARLQQENDFLKKAAAYFAKESR